MMCSPARAHVNVVAWMRWARARRGHPTACQWQQSILLPDDVSLGG